MKKYIFTFGSNHLPDIPINSMSVMLIIEAKNWIDARKQIFKSFIGNKFAFQYEYNEYADEFKVKYGIKEYTLQQLEEMKNE